jgi:hypothetical protein
MAIREFSLSFVDYSVVGQSAWLTAFDSTIWAIPIHRVMQADGCGVVRATAMFGMGLSVNPCGSDFSKYQ